MFQNRTKFGGIGIVIQVGECLLRETRKNNKGRLQLADLLAENLNVENYSDSENVNPLEYGARNYGKWFNGSWVFGLCDNNEGRYFVVQKRDKKNCMKLYKEGLFLGLQYITMAGQGIMDFRTRDTITTLYITAKIL
jgi:hypothetical protein